MGEIVVPLPSPVCRVPDIKRKKPHPPENVAAAGRLIRQQRLYHLISDDRPLWAMSEAERPVVLPPLQKGASMPAQNFFLRDLSPELFNTVTPRLRTRDATAGNVLFRAGDKVSNVYFPRTGAISLVLEL